jgi:predicted phage tail protein
VNTSGTSTAFSNVPAGNYFMRVRAQNSAGTSAPSPEAQVSVGGCVPPGAPGTFSATTSGTDVGLLWSAPASGVAQGYRLVVGSQPGLANVLVQDYPATVTSLAATGVPFGTYYARVLATNVCGAAPPSKEVTVVVQPCAGPPSAPGTLSAATNGNDVSLLCSAPASGTPGGYRLVVGSQPGLADLLVQDFPGAMTSLAASVAYGTYYTRVLATNACGASPASNEVAVVVQPCAGPPQAPTALGFSVSGSFVSLAWMAPAGPAPASYTLQVGSVSGGSDILVFSTGNAATALGASAPPGTYYARVVAQNACGVSGVSNEIVVVVP